MMTEELPISVNILAEYFKDLHNSHPFSAPTHCWEYIEDDILDSLISNEEIRSALNSLKVNKAPGIDQLPPLFKMFDGNSFLNTLRLLLIAMTNFSVLEQTVFGRY